jgi:hypothetical protein
MPKTVERKRKTAPVPEKKVELDASGCAHHWVIAAPDGDEKSVGKCKVCGVTKEFPTSADDYLWERSVPQSRWTGRADSSGMAGY